MQATTSQSRRRSDCEGRASAGWPGDQRASILGSHDADVWLVDLEAGLHGLDGLSAILSPDELGRAGRFRFPRDRARFTVARGALRRILARYLGVRSSSLTFSYSAFGKPSLSGREGRQGIEFSLAYSGGLALVAVVRGRRVGVDVELHRPQVAGHEIARRFFSAAEVAALDGLPPALRESAFFRCWTLKEAYVKACGIGLSVPLDRFSVTVDPALPAKLLQCRDDEEEVLKWSLMDLEVRRGFSAALAVEGGASRLRRIEWTNEVELEG